MIEAKGHRERPYADGEPAIEGRQSDRRLSIQGQIQEGLCYFAERT